MQKRVLLRTAKKLGKFFGFLIFFAGGMFGSAWAGHYFFNEPFLGNCVFLGLIGIGTICAVAYRDAKIEVNLENKILMQELTKHG